MRTGKRVRRAGSRGILGFVVGAFIAVGLYDQGLIKKKHAPKFIFGSGALCAIMSWRRSGR